MNLSKYQEIQNSRGTQVSISGFFSLRFSLVLDLDLVDLCDNCD